jgi:peptidoglycan hydrolase-like protein with peptidoglycan-binding domain
LNALGASPPLAVDGDIGHKTVAAIRQFQAAHGLSANGVPDPATLAALGFVGATSLSGGGSTSSPPAANQVVLPSKNTPLSPEDAAKALNAGYKKVTGKIPTPETLSLLMGQTALETGNWQKMPNFNFGGVKAQSSDPYVQVFKTEEVINGVKQLLDLKFAAYTSAVEGAAGYVRVLLSRPHWAAGLNSGDAAAFVKGLSTAPAYFTADPMQYLAGLQSRVSAYLATAEKYAVPIGIGVGGILLAGGVGVAAWAILRSKGYAS